ncbi:MAG: V-type ATP synthase subunit D, partial [Clostridia bacterium]
MARLNVNPTRMELKRLKVRLATARRGHKLLKDKRDELMKQFLDIVRENKLLRERVEAALIGAQKSFAVASAIMSPEMLEQSLLYPKQSVSLEMSYKNIMSVEVPVYSFKMKNDDTADVFPYSYAMTSGELDDAVEGLSGVMADLLGL